MLQASPQQPPPHNVRLAAESRCPCDACRPGRNQVFPQSLGKNDYLSAYTQNYRKPESGGGSKVTRYDLINKNYIFPQDNFQPESNYTGSYKNNADTRVRTERVNYPDNEMFPKGKFEGNSSYLASYLNAPGSRGEPMRHKDELQVGGKFEGQSNYNENYFNKGTGAKSQKVTFPDNKILPEGRFQELSTYSGNYLSNPVQHNPQIKPQGELKVGGGQFDSNTSYLHDYANRDRVAPREKITIPQNDIMPKGRFEGDSTYGGSYQKTAPPERCEQYRPQGELKIGGKFEGSSSYNQDYDQHGSIQRREKVVYQANQIMPKGGFEGNSTYNGSYQQGQGSPSKMIKHEQQLKIGGQFYGESNYANNYYDKGLAGKQDKFVPPHNKILPEGRFEDATTYTGNYIQNPVQRNQQIKPEGQLKVGGGQFEGTSSYGAEYMKKDMGGRAEKAVIAQNDVMPKGKFAGSSTYEDAYVPSTIERNHQIRPEGNLKLGGKFEGSSIYAYDYDNRTAAPRLNNRNDYIV